jgi:ArsR family transcriptional regulator
MRLRNFKLAFISQVFKALSEEARLRILFLIFKKQSMCISDLELILNFTQTKTSRHITYLKSANILYSKKIDQWVFYFVNEEVYDLVATILAFLEKDQVLQEDLETFRILYSNRELAKHRLENKF